MIIQLHNNNNSIQNNDNIISYDSRFLANALLKAATFLSAAPKFEDPEILKTWLEALSKLEKSTVAACFQTLRKKIDAGDIIYFPKISEFINYANKSFESQIDVDIKALYQASNYPSTLSIYLFKDKVKLSDLAFYLIKQEYKNLEQFQIYIQNIQYRDKTVKILRDKLFEIYIKHKNDQEFKKEVQENLLYTSQKSTSKEIKIDIEEYEGNIQKILKEIRDLNNFQPANYCYNTDGSIFKFDGSCWSFVKKLEL